MKNVWLWTLGSAVLLGLFGTQAKAEEESSKKGSKEVKVALKDVPKKVREAAAKAVKGIKFTEAEKETKGKKVVYELEGKVGEQAYEIEVTPDGKVLKVEKEDDDDDDDAKEEKNEESEKKDD